ncbi:MAG: hypothetical protein IT460_04780 [Planctomycetes bacterium]|nr:hypothetical protein [Planctomycetota bacterium]
MSRTLSRLATLVVALLPLATTGCGLAAAAAAAAISDAIEGDNGDGGDPTVVRVENDPASVDAIVTILVARADGTMTPKSFTVDEDPGDSKSLKDVLTAGTNYVRVVYASGWRSRARSVEVIKDDTVSVSFRHGTTDVASMAGTWFGGGEDGGGTARTWALTLDGSGNASARTMDGSVAMATGTTTETSEGVYRVTWSDTDVWTLVADGARAHAGLATDDGAVAALQKGATGPLPTGVDGDVVGSWVGTQATFSGATFVPTDLDAARATVSAQGHWDAHSGDGDASVGVTPLLASVPAYLRFSADAEDAVTNPLDLDVWLSSDKTFGLAVLWPTAGGAWPDVATFAILEKAP